MRRTVLARGDDATCVYEPRAFAADESTPAGVTLSQFATSLEGFRTTTLTWVNNSPTTIDSFPEPGVTTLSTRVTRKGEARYLTARRTGDGRQRLACLDRIELPAEVQFVTGDGGFVETWDLVLGDHIGGPLVLGAASFSINLDTTPVTGSFRASWRDLRAGETSSLRLGASLSSGAVMGQVTIGREMRTSNGGSGGGTFVARWGGR